MEYSIKIIDTNTEELLAITQFLQESFPKNKKFTFDFIKWQYADNPLGKMVGFNAWENGKIVSHFASMPLEMNLYGRVYKGLLCMNVATNELYRGKKLFTILGEKTIQYAIENAYDFMIAVPNANSSHGFLKYFGFYLISPLTVRVGFGRKIYEDRTCKCFKCWDEQSWKWRLSNPTNQYAYYDPDIVSTPISFFAKSLSKIDSGFVPANSFQKIGVRPLNLYIGLGAKTSKGLYFGLPSFVKRPPFNLVFRDLLGKIPRIKKEDIFLQLIDLDTI